MLRFIPHYARIGPKRDQGVLKKAEDTIAVVMTSEPDVPSVTELLIANGKGDPQAFDRLLPLIYDELKRLAGSHLRREGRSHTLQSTALVHEAYLRLVNQREAKWQNRAHFFAIASQLIRRILVDYARKENAKKRGAGAAKISLDVASDLASSPSGLDVALLNDCLERLEKMDPQQGRVVELRFFGGLSVEETAEAMRISTATVKRDWALAKAWLMRELRTTPGAEKKDSHI
jgi:RNA polymerase sigma factor (TIGR02999 family)